MIASLQGIQLSSMEVSLVNAMSCETILRQYLDTLKGQYSHILIDCQPSLGMLTVNALAAANRIIIPVQAEYLPAKGLEQLLSTVNKVKRQINPKLQIDGILLTMVDNRTNFAKEIAALLRDTYGSKIKVFGTEIPHSVCAKEISAEGNGVLVPAIVRPDPEGGYELIAGHRRHGASELAEKETMPVIARDLDDDAAAIIMPDPALTQDDLEKCGYLDNDLLPLSKERAYELLERDLTVYMIQDGENPETAFDSADLDAHDGIFAVDREEWEQSEQFHEKVMERQEHQQEGVPCFIAKIALPFIR